jgi:predicted dehydrogenase
MAEEQQAFIDCIKNDTTPVCTLSEGMAALEIAETIHNTISQM